MTRKALVEREIKRAKTVKRFASKREGLKKILQDPNASYEEKSGYVKYVGHSAQVTNARFSQNKGS